MVMQAIGQSDRSKTFDRASKYYWGKQYEHLEPWDSEEELQLREKKPSVRVRLTKQTVDTVTAYLFGEGRAPTWKVEAPDTEEGEQAPDTEQINAALQEAIRSSGLGGQYNELGRLACLNGTVGLAFHVFEGGRLDVEVLRLSDAHPTFGRHDRARAIENNIDFDDLLELDEYWRSFQTDPLSGESKEFWHRRRWELNRTVEFVPIDISEIDVLDADAMAALEWVEDEEATVEHELGFVPVEWIKLLEVTNDIDGPPLLDEPEFELEDEVNYTLSQMGRAIRYNGEPKVVFTDVDNMNKEALKTGSQHTWSITSSPSKNATAGVELLELNGAGQQVGFEYVDRIRRSLHEVARVVIHDPQSWSGTLSGTALKLMLAPMVALIQDVRPQFEKGIGRLLSKMLRALDVGEFDVTATWPDVVEWTPDDVVQMLTAVQLAFDQGFITRKTAVSMLAAYFNIDDVDAYLEELAGEAGQGGTATATPTPTGGGLDGLL
jgi:hypothetical protein